MSSKNTRSTTSPLRHAHGVLGQLLRDFAFFPALIFNILFRPARTGSKIIHNNPGSLFHALKFYSEMFTLSFMISVAASQFQLFEGASEWRGLLYIAMQVLIAIPIIYILCFAFLPEKIPLSNMMQAVFYVDGAFILILAAASIPISYLDFTLHIPTANRELDIFATEYERCLAHNSILFRLMRGEIQFFLYIDRWKPQDWANWLFDNYNYLVGAPFLLVFAFMLGPKRKISVILICLFAAIAYTASVEGSAIIKRRTGSPIAGALNAKCTSDHLDQVINKYAPNLIARQIVYKINNEALKAREYRPVTSVVGTEFVVTLKLDSNFRQTWQQLAQLPPAIRQSYCSDYLYWVAARRINYNLLVVINDKDNTLLHSQGFTPKDCPAWPAADAPK